MTEFEDFKNFEKEGWEERASTYDKWASANAKQIIPTAVNALALSKDDIVLELASGPGYGTNEIAKISHNVIGTDFAEAMVLEARKQNPGLKFEQGDAENLMYSDNSFTKILCTFGILHFAHPDKAIKEVGRILKQNGLFVFTVWAPAQESPFFGMLAETIGELGSYDVGLPTAPPIDDFSDPDRASERLSAQGLVMTNFEAINNIFNIGVPANSIPQMYREVAVRSKGLLDSQDPKNLPAIESKLIERFKEFEINGSVSMPFPYRLVTAKKI